MRSLGVRRQVAFSLVAILFAGVSHAQNSDFRLNTIGVQGPQGTTRSFTVSANQRAVTIRYRFITEEVPGDPVLGSLFGTEYDDSL